MASDKLPAYLLLRFSWAIAWAYVAPLQSVLISLYKKSPFLAKVFFGFLPSNHQGIYNNGIIIL
jgi:hypothetical protein